MWIIADVLLCCISLFALFAINIDRLVFVIKPLTYTMVMRKTHLRDRDRIHLACGCSHSAAVSFQ